MATSMPAFADNHPPTPQPTGTVSTGEQYDTLCDGVQGPSVQGDGFIYKFIITRSDNVDGSATFLVKLWGNLGILPSESPVLDCLWVDSDGNQARSADERVMGARVDGLVITPDNSINGRGYFSVRVPGAANKTVCDQAHGVRFGQALPTDPTAADWRFRSWVMCSSPMPPVEIPEAGSVVLLGLSGALAGAAVLVGTGRRRRRHHLAAADAPAR